MGWETGVQLKWKFTPTIDSSSEVTFSGVLKGPSSFKVKSPSFSAFRAVLLKLQCSYESPGGFDKRQNLTGLGWGPDTTDTAFWQAPRPCYCCGCCWPMAQALNREA